MLKYKDGSDGTILNVHSEANGSDLKFKYSKT